MSTQTDQIRKAGTSTHEWLFLAGAFLVALGLRELVHVKLFPDSVDYLSFARNVLEGIHHTGDITIARYRRPPLYPHLVAMLSWGRSDPAYLAEVARQVSIFSGAFLVLPLYLLGRRILCRLSGAAAVLFAVFTPELLYYSGTVLTESLATLLGCAALYLLWLIHSRRPQFFLPLLLGIVLGLAFLARHLMIGFVGVSLVWLLFPRKVPVSILGRFVVPSLGILAGFLLTIFPQVAYLHQQTGEWSLAEDPFSITQLKISQVGQDTRYTEDYEARASLTPDGEHYLWEKGASPGLVSLIVKHPKTYLKAYFHTLFRGYLPDTYPFPYPWISLGFGLIGLAVLIGARRWRELLFCAWGFGGYYLFLALFLNMRDRYMVPVYPLLLLVSGHGAGVLVQAASSRIRSASGQTRVKGVVAAIVGCLIAVALLPNSCDLIQKQAALDNVAFYNRLGGQLSEKIHEGAILIDRSPHLAYFAGGRKVAPPYAEIEEVLRFARKRRIDYWVVSTFYVPHLRPQYTPLLDPTRHHKGLEPVAMWGRPPEAGIIVYRIQ